jgi:hypothetical protein
MPEDTENPETPEKREVADKAAIGEKAGTRLQNTRLLPPEEALKKIACRIPPYCRWAAVSAFVMGLAAHMFFLVNKLPNGDDLSELYHNNSMVSSGRWLDVLSKGLVSYYSIPWATGLVCLALLAVSCAFLCSLLNIRRKSGVLAAAALLVTFPTMASYFSYLYYMDLYMLTLLFSVLAVWLCRKFKWGFLPGALLVALALGNYQAYLGVTAVLCLLTLIGDCLSGAKKTREILALTGRYLVMGVLGCLLYLLILQWALGYFATALSFYQGIAKMGLPPLDAALLLDSTKDAYASFLGYFYWDRFFTSPFLIKIVYALLLGLSLAWLVLAAARSLQGGTAAGSVSRADARQEKSSRRTAGLSRLLLCLLFLGGLPLAYHAIYFMAPNAFLHSLMQPQYALFWLMPLMFYELAYPAPCRRVSFFQSLSRWLLLGGAAALVYFFFLTVNISYLHLHLKYEITYATELRILDRIEGLPDYRPDTPVCVIGAFPNENMSLYPYHTQDIASGLVGINGNLVHHYYNYNGFYKNYLGRQLNLFRDDDGQKSEIADWPAVQAMPLWPKNGSVAMIEGIVIVKIN